MSFKYQLKRWMPAPKKISKGYKPIKDRTIPAAQVWKEPGLEGAMFSYRVTNSATRVTIVVLSSVWLGDTTLSKIAVQSCHQAKTIALRLNPSCTLPVLKPVHCRIQIPDAPLTYQTFGDKLWKPGNYGNSYSETGYLVETSPTKIQILYDPCTRRSQSRVSSTSTDQTPDQLHVLVQIQSRTHIQPMLTVLVPQHHRQCRVAAWCETIDPILSTWFEQIPKP